VASEYQVHLISGSTGAGKTTYARELSERIEGVCFSIDRWMSTLFWEVPSADEMTAHNAVCIKSQPPLGIGRS